MPLPPSLRDAAIGPLSDVTSTLPPAPPPPPPPPPPPHPTAGDWDSLGRVVGLGEVELLTSRIFGAEREAGRPRLNRPARDPGVRVQPGLVAGGHDVRVPVVRGRVRTVGGAWAVAGGDRRQDGSKREETKRCDIRRAMWGRGQYPSIQPLSGSRHSRASAVIAITTAVAVAAAAPRIMFEKRHVDEYHTVNKNI